MTKARDMPVLTERPIIGILAHDPSQFLLKANFAHSSKVVESYVKFMEQGGARVVPIMLDKDADYYDMMFQATNGLILPGGSAEVTNSGYERAAKEMYERALASPDYYPIWGECLGLEQLLEFGTEMQDFLKPCEAENFTHQLIPHPTEWAESHIGKSMPSDIYHVLTTESLAFNNHQNCVTPDQFEKFDLGAFWRPLSVNTALDGQEFHSFVEARQFPFWGLGFHPEKAIYEWSTELTSIPHTVNAIKAGAFFAQFFVQECRKNDHHFESREMEEKFLINNFKSEFVGRMGVDYKMMNVYLFN